MKYSFLLCLIFLFIYIGCDFPTNTLDSVTEKSIIQNGIEYTVSIPANAFNIADTIQVNFKIKNNTDSTVQFNFNNLPQLGFMLSDVYNNVAMFYPSAVSPSLSKIILSRNETKELTARSSFKNFNGIYINRGHYLLSVYLSNNNSPVLKLDIKIN